MSEDNELVRPDPFWVRLEIANEFERLATEIRARACYPLFSGEQRAVHCVADAIDERASKLRGQLGAEADREARQQERDAAE